MEGLRPPLSLYVHLPWCARKCPYCDFNSYAAAGAPPRQRYLRALIDDLAAESERAAGRPLISVFLGGGTPSLFEPAEIGALIDAVAARFSLAADIEITLEANPGTVECGDPSGYRRAGINRISLGAQSFDDGALGRLGRIHKAADIARAFRSAREAGFDNINLDLMYALPGQANAGALADIEAAAGLGPEHLSWYQLTLEPNTVFHARPPAGLPDADAAADMQVLGQALLAELGYEQYEVSAYARGSRRSVHNLNYWLYGDYLAVGAGAHGKLTSGDEVLRCARPANPLAYMEAIESGTYEPELQPRTPDERLFEFMLNASRLTAGFDETVFERHTGLGRDFLRQRLAAAVEKGLIGQPEPGTWRPTALGAQFLNNLQAEFLPAA
jgi:oxygen-independent coproporphyrinogen-3 oxidase